MPAVSVLMGIYNCESTLREAVNSVLSQTFTDWELIMCDDGSTDETYKIASEIASSDSRIILLKNYANSGLPKTLNKCAASASADIFARMDGDDVCAPDRFEKEYALIIGGEYDIVSCGMNFFDENGVYGKKLYAQTPEKKDFAGNSPFCHAGSMFTRKAFDTVGGYSESLDRLRVEDFDLWFRMYKQGFKGFNIQEYLYSMRDDRNATARKKFVYRINEYKLKRDIAKAFGFGIKGKIRALRPVILGLCPNFIYKALHRAKLGGEK